MGRLVSVLASCALLGGGGALAQQDYPARPVKMIAPFAPGATGDLTARVAADYFEKQFKQPFVVENKAGAGGVIGATEVKRAAPDGYTLLVGLDGMTTFPILMKDNTFDLAKDVAPIAMLARFPLVLLGNTAGPGRSLQETLAFAKANPGKLNFGIVTNSPGHLFAILFANRTGVNATLIPYPGAVALTQSLVSHETHATASVYGSFAAQIKAGKIAALGIAGPRRIKADPSVPTLAESGVPLSMGVWYALFAPLGTPQAVIARLASASAELARQPEVQERFDKLGIEFVGLGPAELARQVADDMRERAEAARLGKIQPQ